MNYDTVIRVRVDEDLSESVKNLCKQRGITLSRLLRDLLNQELNQKHNEKKKTPVSPRFLKNKTHKSRWHFSRIRPMSIEEVKGVYDDYRLNKKGVGLFHGCKLEDNNNLSPVNTWLFTSNNVSNILMVNENLFWDSKRPIPKAKIDNVYILLQKSKWDASNPSGIYGWHCRISSISTDFGQIHWWGDDFAGNNDNQIQQTLKNVHQSFQDILENLIP